MTAPGTSRYCRGCGCRIARDNRAAWCSPCQHREFEHTARAPRQPEAFWETDHIRDALASRDIGVVVCAYRHHPAHGPRPLTQARMAGWLGITQPHLSRIESGHNQIRDLDKLERYARRLRVPAYLLWFTIDEQEEQPQHTAGTVELPGGLDIAVAVVPTGPALAAHLRGSLRHYVAMDNLTGPRPLLAVVAQQIAFIEQLLANATGSDRADPLDAAARFTEFAGWLHQDAGDLRAAMHWTNAALDYAHEVGDARMVCYVLMRKSNIASDAGRPDQAMAFAEAGLAEPRHLTPHLRAVLLRQQAHAFALRREHAACARCLGMALDCALRDDDFELVGYCTPGYIEMEAANCWVELGRPRRAIDTLQRGLCSWQPEFRRDLGLGLARLGLAYACAGELDHAWAFAQHSLGIATETRSARTTRQLTRVHRHLCGRAELPARRLARALRDAARSEAEVVVPLLAASPDEAPRASREGIPALRYSA